MTLERGRLVRHASDPRFLHAGPVGLTEDRDGNVWVSTQVQGAMKIARHGLITYDQSDGLGQGINAIFENRAGDLLVSSAGYRISRFDGHGFRSVRLNLPAAVDDESWRMYRGNGMVPFSSLAGRPAVTISACRRTRLIDLPTTLSMRA